MPTKRNQKVVKGLKMEIIPQLRFWNCDFIPKLIDTVIVECFPRVFVNELKSQFSLNH